MKFSCMIFICPMIIASAMAMMQLTHTTFESCNPDAWVMTNTTLKWINETKMITCNITYKEADNSTIYRIHIVISDCINHTACTGKSKIWIENMNCDAQNLTESDMDACKIANELGNMEKEKEWLIFRYGLLNEEMLYKLVFCIDIDNINLSWNDKSIEYDQLE